MALRQSVPVEPMPAESDREDVKICKHCGKVFHLYGRSKRTRYCDTDCYRAHNAKHNREKYRQEHDISEEEVRICQHCGKDFTLKNRHGSAKYCGDECFKAHKRAKAKEQYWKNKEAEDA